MQDLIFHQLHPENKVLFCQDTEKKKKYPQAQWCHFTPFVSSSDGLLSLGKEETELVKKRLASLNEHCNSPYHTIIACKDLEFLQRALAQDYYSILKMGQA
eukprot:scaffold50111_cov40-Attheya_sp.AAC.1